MGLFSRKGRAARKWRARARMIDPKKTRLILVGNSDAKHVPSWFYREFPVLDQASGVN